MINLRYHIVSLVAVFLALGLGILMGSTVIDQGLVRRLEEQTTSLAGSLKTLRAQNDTLQSQQALWDGFVKTTLVPLTKSRLKGRVGVLLLQDGTDTKVADAIQQSLIDAGASMGGRLALTAKWGLKDDPTRQQLELALGVQQGTANTLLATAADRIAVRLGQSAEPTASPDLLASLRDAGFLSVDTAGPGSFPPQGAFLVVIPAGTKDARPPQPDFFVPLLRALATSRRVAVAEPMGADDSLADRVRGDDQLRTEIATVDDADILVGRVALVYALRSLTGEGLARHFGARRSATSLVPESFAG